MGSFKRGLFGYRRRDVDAAMGMRDARIWALEHDIEAVGKQAVDASDGAVRAERELELLSSMVLEREREIRHLNERLWEANQRHDRSIASLESTAGRLEEIQAQARGQATRIRMKALSEAVEVGRRAQEVAGTSADAANDAIPAPGGGEQEPAAADFFEGDVKVEIGPLGDFSQLVSFEDMIGNIGASDVSVERFSEGRATLSMRLEEPIELLRELEEHAAIEFRVRRTSDDGLILDLDEDSGPDQQAA